MPKPPLLIGVVAAALALACAGDATVPGDEVIGRFRFAAELIDRGCTFEEIPEDGRFEFEGTFSLGSDGQGAWFTVAGVDRDGGWDGQRFESTHSAPRRFEDDRCDSRFIVAERLHVAILSASQDAALGGECPADAQALLVEGAVPVDPDAGVTPPGPQETGYDAVRSCGVLIHQVTPEDACPEFSECTLTWRVTGGRRL